MNSQSLVPSSESPHERNICNVITISIAKSLANDGGQNDPSMDKAS
ncbi:MAG TPA: hypothetical protein VFH19_04445 [Nitrososphaeraceae archaeon]|nr:hypothetical protein [Nitrososphaeraceae archaeon]